jgi:hypothetical protein
MSYRHETSNISVDRRQLNLSSSASNQTLWWNIIYTFQSNLQVFIIKFHSQAISFHRDQGKVCRVPGKSFTCP